MRGSINSCKEIIFFGRTSTYGLKRWEKENPLIKGGTIRDIVEEYLLKFEEPKHISEIIIYVNKFRNTNERNIITNLLLDKSGRFIVYKDAGFIGLTIKNYDDNQLQFENVPANAISEIKKG